MKEGLVETNPALATNTHRIVKSRNRVLSDTELAEVWRAAGDDAYGTIVRLLILTGQRREEIGALRWSEIDFAAALIRLPAARTKTGRPHDIPLAEPAIFLLQAKPRRIGPKDFVFGTTANGFGGFSAAKAALDQRIGGARQAAGAEPMRPWVLHDLRRSVATRMAELGVPPHVVEAILNHVSGHKAGVAGVYNRATYLPEKIVALARWADHLLAVATGKPAKVVPPVGLRRVKLVRMIDDCTFQL
jgi:integrase